MERQSPPITPAGMAALRERYDHLLGAERPAIVEIIGNAPGMAGGVGMGTLPPAVGEPVGWLGGAETLFTFPQRLLGLFSLFDLLPQLLVCFDQLRRSLFDP